MSHDSLSEDLFEVLLHDEALAKSSLRHFFQKNFLFGQNGPNMAQNYKPIALEVCNSSRLVTFVKLSKKILFLD